MLTATPYVVRRSALRMWAIALGGVPMVVIGVDLLTRHRILDFFRELMFRPDDTQLAEPRDYVWAAALVVIGLLLCGWGLKELIAPTRILVADGTGLGLKVRGPFRAPVHLSWDEIDDVGSGTVDDDGTELPVMWVRVFDRTRLPPSPWGGRWLDDERTLALLAADWDVTGTDAAAAITEWAVAATAPDSEPEG